MCFVLSVKFAICNLKSSHAGPDVMVNGVTPRLLYTCNKLHVGLYRMSNSIILSINSTVFVTGYVNMFDKISNFTEVMDTSVVTGLIFTAKKVGSQE